MSERNVVRQYIQRAGSGATKVGLAATLALSMTPALAIAQQAGNENAQEAAAITATNTDATASEASLNAEASSSVEQYSIDDAAVQSVATQAASSTTYDLAKIADGEYTGTAVVGDNGLTIDGNESGVDDGDSWKGYTVTVQATVDNHAIVKVDVSTDAPRNSKPYVSDAVDGYEDGGESHKGVPSQIVEGNGTGAIDAVTGATVTSKAIVSAVDNALQTAYDKQNASTPATDEYTYGYAALTWAEYWANEGVYNASDVSSSDVLDSHNEYDKGGFDVVTRATYNHGPARGAFQCTSVFHTSEGTDIEVAYWTSATEFVCPDGTTGTVTTKTDENKNKIVTISCSGADYTETGYSLTGTRYVAVKVKTSDLEAFEAKYQFVANGDNLYVGQQGSSAEKAMQPYAAVANVTEDTNALKTVEKNADGSFSFSKAKAGTDSGIEGQVQKTADLSDMAPDLKRGDAVGSFGEFMRIDFGNMQAEKYGDLGANMQSVTWTYYGDDATRTNAVRTFGTKFAADNWMHSSMGIQLGLTDSVRCEFPEGYDGTGYWTVTIHALGYADSSYDFEATSENISHYVQPVTDATKAKLQDTYDKAASLNEADYTADSWKAFVAERDETAELLKKEGLGEAEAAEQTEHLQAAIDALVKDGISAGDYLLMNVPYADLYAADTTNNAIEVDVFTSATKAKSKTGKLSGGSYGGISNDADDTAETTQISGAQFPVRVTEAAAKKIKSGDYTQVTDQTSIDVTTTNRGQTSTTTYAGQKALYAEGDWAYYALGSEPSFYKELDVDANGNFVLSAVKGTAPETVKTDATFTTETTYGDYELDLDSATVESKFDHETDFIYTVLVNAVDENGTAYSYGLRPLENVWLGNELAWCSTDLIPAVHNCPTSYEHYQSIMGKTVQSVTYYTEKGAYTFELNDAVKVPVKASKSELNVEASSKADATTAEVTATFPSDFTAEYTLDGKTVSVSNGQFSIEGLKPGTHTLVAHDASDKYADVMSEFIVSTDKTVAEFDESATKITAANEGDDVENFIANITTVNVNGTDYAASGRGSVTIINKDGSINLAAAAGGQQGGQSKAAGQQGGQQSGNKVFANYGSYTIKVTSTGYNTPLEFVFNYKADRTSLNEAIGAADKVTAQGQSDYTDASWAAFQSALTSAKDAQSKVDATDDEIAQALTALTDAQAALAAKATDDSKAELNQQIGAGSNLNQSDYTEDSWKAYADALATAQKLAKDSDASDVDVQAAAAALKQAREALAKPSSETPATPQQPSAGAQSNNGTQSGADSQQSAANNGDKAGTFAQTNDATSAFGIAALAAAFAAAIAGAVAFARRRLLGK